MLKADLKNQPATYCRLNCSF